MAQSYNRKSAAELAFDRNKKQLRHAARLVMDEVLNTATADMSDQFVEAFTRGEVIEIRDLPSATAYLRAAVQKQLGA